MYCTFCRDSDRLQRCGAGAVPVGGRRRGTLGGSAIDAGLQTQVEEYYYDHLPEELHEAYREIYVHLMKNEDEGSFLSEVSVDDFWRAYYAVLADHPEIFWIGTSAQVEGIRAVAHGGIVFAGDDGSAEGP